jgi:hypothetical protein
MFYNIQTKLDLTLKYGTIQFFIILRPSKAFWRTVHGTWPGFNCEMKK